MESRQDMTCRELITAVGNYRERFLRGQATANDRPAYVLPEVTESWERMLQSNANPATTGRRIPLDQEGRESVLLKRKHLVNVASSVLNASIQKDTNAFCSIGVLDKDSVMLTACAKGESIVSFLRDNHVFDAQSTKSPLIDKNSVITYGGFEYSEETMGTSAWSLVQQTKKPAQIVNTDQFSDAYAKDNQIITAIPILNADRSIFAIVVYTHNLDESLLDTSFSECARLDLNFAGAIAATIERHAHHQEAKPVLVNMKNAARDYGVILANEAGDITCFEDRLFATLGIEGEKAPSNIEELFPDDADFYKTILSGVRCSTRRKVLKSRFEVGVEAESNTVACSLLNASVLVKIKTLSFSQINEQRIAEQRGQIGFSDILGTSASTMRLKRICTQFASSDENVLLAGESGTGKELVARAMHNESRPQHPFVVFCASAIPKDLLKSALFGYEPDNAEGGTTLGKAGAIELAGQGTLFLDEIADIPLTVQASLLRIIDDRTVTRIGGTKPRAFDCRIIASTNRNIRDLIKRGMFREDLYYRLATLGILIDPLRKRPADVIPIYRDYLQKVCEKRGTPIPMVSESFVEALQDCEWPGNVRQLQNAIIYAVNMAEAEQSSSLSRHHLPPLVVLGSAADEHGIIKEDAEEGGELFNLSALEKKTIQRAYRVFKGNPTRMASALGISMSTLNRRLREYGLTKEA